MPALFKLNDNFAELILSGEWTLAVTPDGRDEVVAAVAGNKFSELRIDGTAVGAWDSRLIAFLVRVISVCKEKNAPYTLTGFADGVDGLLTLAFTVPEHIDERVEIKTGSFLVALGNTALKCADSVRAAYAFSRETAHSFKAFFTKKAVVRFMDIMAEIEQAGVRALPIVSLICFLVGLILAFVGSIQLTMFGAQIYVASLVAIGITRVMGAIMGGVIMAGRTGASYAATLGSMQVNEEVDALKTMGISPFDFLVLPRVLALSLMMPLLTIYADLMGILGGAFVGVCMLGLSPEDYFRMTLKALNMRSILIGLTHGAVYGVIIALCGCYHGINCGRNATAVGVATTKAVVSSIVWMTVATAFLTFIFSVAKV